MCSRYTGHATNYPQLCRLPKDHPHESGVEATWPQPRKTFQMNRPHPLRRSLEGRFLGGHLTAPGARLIVLLPQQVETGPSCVMSLWSPDRSVTFWTNSQTPIYSGGAVWRVSAIHTNRWSADGVECTKLHSPVSRLRLKAPTGSCVRRTSATFSQQLHKNIFLFGFILLFSTVFGGKINQNSVLDSLTKQQRHMMQWVWT